MKWRRRAVVVVMVLLTAAFGCKGSARAQTHPAPRGELRIVDKDPANWVWITFNIFEHLIQVDKDGELVPKLATGWRWLDDRTLEIKLRQGVKFHNGEVFDAEIVKLNWKKNQVKKPFEIGEFMKFSPGSRVEIVDPRTVRFIFPEPDGGALVKLAFMHIGNRQFYEEVGWGDKHW